MFKGLEKSFRKFQEAKEYIPGGVNSPVRAFSAVNMDPPFIARGDGSRIYDIDGNEYIDYVASWGPLILGHRHPSVIDALKDCLEIGTSFGAPTELETEIAQMIAAIVPSIDKVRMVNSGTEATMSALRLARGFTGRNKIVKFEGCYHGHADQLLIKAGSGALTLGVPTSPGVPANIASNTIVAPFNNLEALQEIFAKEGKDIAAVIVEPVAGNMGCVLPRQGFLQGLREVTQEYAALLIFDEVMTGFRVSLGGAQEYYGVDPDLTCLGKIIGGGLPVGAYGGKTKIMDQVAPQGAVYQAGTLSGNPLAMSAGIATLRELSREGVYADLEEKTKKLTAGLMDAAIDSAVDVQINQVGGMFSLFFSSKEVVDYDSVLKADSAKFRRYFRTMLENGIYLAPSPFEAAFMSLAHSDDDIVRTVNAARKAFETVKEESF